ncbi:sporulation associated protein [Aspergillus heteromorphus CBS 117.55]|uniref:Sporulation associated protein n=1 Tax=Aspergillus heteromorphus CBS 117.55 TaxID=1448321 RepID=A0A317V6P4_9EURO|nr:sporulation associated protein [Aspergillus heteromorphus CBS 117.55]PWY69715.1 sporulation associated protein [Aspergillus heteromorphus CBS 117.55]
MSLDPCNCPPPTRELVLCFDGTGNTFRADGGESNILKIFRMLDRRKDHRYCYYQPGIGTDITPGTFANMAFRPFSNLPAHKVMDQALATSFDQHVINGYRFLARRWVPGTRIYMFGFSRGAYTARFLNEMLDFIGLISADNEEIIPLVWQAFTRYKIARNDKEANDAEYFLKMCRDTMCRSVGLVHFLGLFDTVNSVAEFNNDLQRTQPKPHIMRHAVSIDERRIKFQPVLFDQLRGAHARACRVSTWAERADLEFQSSSGLVPPPPSETDFEEVYFAGDHSDVGGGWPRERGSERWVASQIPLMWMVEEAIEADLTFDPTQLHELGCFNYMARERYDEVAVKEASEAVLHDSLLYDSGKGLETLFWRVLECLPIKRPKVAPDGTVQETRWHVGGLRRPLPEGAKLHFSVIDRMKKDPTYRPYNLGVGNRPDVERVIEHWPQVVHDKELGHDKAIENGQRARTRQDEERRTLCWYYRWHRGEAEGGRRLHSRRSERT